MKTIPIHLLNMYASECTSIAYLWRLKRTDGFILGLTDTDLPIRIGDQIYHPGGFTPTANRTQNDLSVGNVDAEGILDPAGSFITNHDMISGKWNFAEILLSRCDYNNPEAGQEVIRRGWMGEINTNVETFRAEMRGLTQRLQASMAFTVEPNCRHSLGGKGCGADLALYTFDGEVTGVPDDDVITDDIRAETAGYFNGGSFVWLSGRNIGVRTTVQRSVGKTIALQGQMMNPIQIGDTYRAVRGCNKLRDGDCLNVFNNTINHGGFEDLPGRDRLTALASGQKP